MGALTRASYPLIVVHDVDFSGGVNEAKELAGNNGYRIFLVVDVRQGEMRVYEVSEGLVADL